MFDTTPTGAGPRARRRLLSGTSAAGILIAALLLGGCSSRAEPGGSSSDDSYGSLPTFLPTDTIRPDSMLTGVAGRPAVTSEGDAVDARVGAATVHIVVGGPVVPGEGLPNVTPATTCTWTVTLSNASRAVPVAASDFTAVDELGHTYRPHLVPGEPRPPATIRPGQHVSFQLRVVMPTGEGVMRWAPHAEPLAVWDFVVEND